MSDLPAVQDQPVVDIHAHHLPAALHPPTRAADDPRWPYLVIDDDGRAGRIMRGSEVFRRVKPALWDVPTRLAELDRAGVDVQVVSPVPVTLSPWADSGDAADFLRRQNDLLAEAVAASAGRLRGLGAVPLQDVDAAIGELLRIKRESVLDGIEIGTRIGDLELDAPQLRPFFAAAEEAGVPLFVHPTDGPHATRRAEPTYAFGVGMLTDTALAATALVFGGVLDDFPGLRVALAHGCGAFPWTYPRTAYGDTIVRGGPDPERTARLDRLVGSLWADTLVFDPEHLRLVAERLGAGHLMLGTDHPFLRAPLETALATVSAAADRNVLSERQVAGVLGRNALRFLGL
ncbi:amidohydrolase family protein [Streptomyces sp. NY05-11A]|uniref:amidohydrolase family protein n=1 Tax=Streptomyces soliscabiei TaxID=588897 RepID=UPI0029A85A22|nr:amidohydrolase family protein [Streptomyces sp. NY05-11A]MDX2675087.1 amidohydrolase family protein [Streptomyces sp. NY05-11A]